MAQIKKDTSLRKAILQAAITGQLISSCHSELDSESAETGKELLDKIIEERNNKLLTEWEEKQTDLFASNDAHSKNAKTVRSEQIRLLKKAKKPALVVASEIDEEEIPFEIPENWCWCRLGDLAFIARGGSPRPINEYLTNDPDGYNWIKISDTDKGGKYINSTKQKIKKEGLYKTRLIHKGDFLLTNSMSFGRPYISNIEGCIHDGWLVFSFPNKCISPDFIYHLLSSSFIYNQFADSAAGAVVQNLNTDKVIETLIPLPPLSVQNAIVETLEQVLPLVDAYENAVLQKEELKNALPDKVKKAILQEAITGQLTENWRKSATIKESGKQLLDRIIEERNAKALAEWEEKVKTNPKAKKPAPIVASEIDEEEIPFEVPESWCWCRWGELSELIQYGYNAPAKESGRIKMVRITDIQNGKVQWNTVPFCEISDTDIQVYQLRKNDILFARTGGTVGKSFLVDEEPENAVFAGYLIRTQYDDKKLNPKYMKMFMESQIYWDQLKNGTIATAQPNCNGQTLSKMILPLPPLEEQEKIVKKVEELLELCK